jgi:hypothetical protein
MTTIIDEPGEKQSMNGQDIDTNDLRPDLRGSYKADGPLTLDHPLLRTNANAAKKINELYEQRLALARHHYREMNWLDLLNLFEKPYRLPAFAAVAPKMSDTEYSAYLRPVWMDTENPHQHLSLCVSLFRSSRLDPEGLMSDEDRRAFKELPGTMRIYRGHRPDKKNSDGISWTLDRDVAEKLGGRRGSVMANDETEIRDLTIEKSNAVAYFDGRREQEIIYLGDFPEDFPQGRKESEDLIEVITHLLGVGDQWNGKLP